MNPNDLLKIRIFSFRRSGFSGELKEFSVEFHNVGEQPIENLDIIAKQGAISFEKTSRYLASRGKTKPDIEKQRLVSNERWIVDFITTDRAEFHPGENEFVEIRPLKIEATFSYSGQHALSCCWHIDQN